MTQDKKITKVNQQEIEVKHDEAPLILEIGDDINAVVTRAEKQIEAVNKIKKLALKVTNKHDWVDQDGQPYLESTGVMKIRQLFGVDIFDQKISPPQTLKDDKGEYILVQVEGKARFHGKTIDEIGTCSTRDNFFGKINGEYKPLSEVDIENVIKKSVTNFQNRVLKKILGLSYTWEELAESGIRREDIISVRHKNAMKGERVISGDEKRKQSEIYKWLSEIYCGEIEEIKKWLKEATTFTTKDGEQVAGIDSIKSLVGKRLDIVYGKAKKEYDNFKKNLEISPGKIEENNISEGGIL